MSDKALWSPPGGIPPGTIIFTTNTDDRSGYRPSVDELLDELGISIEDLGEMVADDVEAAPPALVRALRSADVQAD